MNKQGDSSSRSSTRPGPDTLAPSGGTEPIRHSELLDAGRASLLVIDVQDRLIRLIDNYQRVAWNVRRLIDGATLMQVPAIATEQYPKGLGRTVASLSSRLPNVVEKSMFSCRECATLPIWDAHAQRDQVVVCGIETHVCVQQTAMDLLANGMRVYVVADSVGSRFATDYQWAIARMEKAGAIITTTESVLFEWCADAVHPQFKALSQLIREPFESIFVEPDQAPVSQRAAP